jgi:hypothetical protein
MSVDIVFEPIIGCTQFDNAFLAITSAHWLKKHMPTRQYTDLTGRERMNCSSQIDLTGALALLVYT